MSMKPETKKALIAYVDAMMNGEGIAALHVSNLIPPTNRCAESYYEKPSSRWTQFVELDLNDLPPGITYDRPSGWFRKLS